MNISKISNATFKGAYIIAGMGKDAIDVKRELLNEKHEMFDIRDGAMEVNDVGLGYLDDNMPAYFLVTTGADVERYNEFAKNWDLYYDMASAKYPNDCIDRDYFESDEEYAKAIIRNEASTCLDAIGDYCRFENGKPGILGAKSVVEAIKKDKFDFATGNIIAK